MIACTTNVSSSFLGDFSRGRSALLRRLMVAVIPSLFVDCFPASLQADDFLPPESSARRVFKAVFILSMSDLRKAVFEK